ncbi:MAG: Hsp33 family molecular chaperone HslO [Treponema sp.]
MIAVPLTDEVLQKQFEIIEKDAMTVFVAADGLFRGALFHGTRLVNTIKRQHHLGIAETLVLGQAGLCAALAIQTMKGKEALQIRYETDGIAQGFSMEAQSSGVIRGYLLQDAIPLENLSDAADSTGLFGSGTLTVSRFTENTSGTLLPPQTGSVEIQYRNIAQDLAYYFLQSEQIYTAFQTGIHFDSEGRVMGAGGLFIQRMPAEGGHSHSSAIHTYEDVDNTVAAMERALSACPPLGQWFSEQGTIEDIIYGLFREFKPQIVASRSIIFHCPCSKEQYLNSLRTLPLSERKKLSDNPQVPLEVVCRNCSSVYHILPDEL